MVSLKKGKAHFEKKIIAQQSWRLSPGLSQSRKYAASVEFKAKNEAGV
jgi:hypothetical protein